MELSPYLISVQGVFTSAVKKHGMFTKIKYKGGNEMKISAVIKDLANLFEKQAFFVENAPNPKYTNELEDVVLFLVLNCEFDTKFEVDDCQHLMHIMPNLSKCLLSNIVVELGLSKILSKVFSKLPLSTIRELLSEIMICVKKANPTVTLQNTYTYVKRVMIILRKTKCESFDDNLDKLTDICIEMLLNLTGFNEDSTELLRPSKIYLHMGFTLLRLFKLLRDFNEEDVENQFLARLSDHLLRTTCSVIRAVTINVFCTWAETDYNGEPLQTAVSTEAYFITEKFIKCKPAKELLQMLECIARKPLPLQERVLQADEATVIKMVEKGGNDQQIWFRGLLNTQSLNSKSAMKCVEQFYELCTLEDVERVLSICATVRNPQVNELMLKCASSLDLTDLKVVILRHFANVGITNMLENAATVEQLTLLLNRMRENPDDAFEKQVLLLLLQNPVEVLSILYGECIKNCVYTTCLRHLFAVVKDILSLDSLGVNVLVQIVEKNRPADDNLSQYTEFFKMLIGVGCVNYDKMYEKVILPYLQSALNDREFDRLFPMLSVCNTIFVPVHLTTTAINAITTLINILEASRCGFFSFDARKQNVTREAVRLLQRYSTECRNAKVALKPPPDRNVLLKYYSSRISGQQESSLFKYLFPNFASEDYHEFLLLFVKYMPMCVAEEWISISASLDCVVRFVKTLEILQDLVLLLCETAKTQMENEHVAAAFRYCLMNYRSAVKDLLESNNRNLEDEIALARSICRVLRDLPQEMKQEEGLLLISLLTDRSLTSLADDKQFVCGLMLIKESKVTQALALKMLK